MKRLILMILLGAVLSASLTVDAHATDTSSWPVSGALVRPFDPPTERWGAGHRGVDLSAPAGFEVVSPAAGSITFTGIVAGRPLVVISHGVQRTTLEPVVGSLPVGTAVDAGQVVGHLQSGHAGCPTEACLHWGLRDGDTYLDPLSLVLPSVRLLPEEAVADVQKNAADRAAAAALTRSGTAGSGKLSMPTQGRLTSTFGPRFHPIFHEWRQHQGIDLSASCGTPILAAADGVVTHAAYDASGGWRLIIDHGTLDGVAVQTVSLHAQGYQVRAGDPVTRGQVVGTVGSTGWSTGCHLHFSVKVDGQHADPEAWL